MKLTYIKQSGEPNGDAGDQYTGLDRFGRVVDQRWPQGSSELERVDYGFTAASNRQWRQNLVAAGGQDEYYTYDGLYQVAELNRGTLNSGKTAISGTPAWTEDFTYDPIGNWQNYLTKVSGVTDLDQSRTHNTANETVEIDGSTDTIAHDLAGNMVRVPQVADWSSTNELTWDAWNRLVEVVDGETTVAQYRYDGITRRISKEADATRHYYYSAQWQIIEERVDDGTDAERQFIWGQRYLDDLVLRDRDVDADGSLDERLYVLSDYFNPTAIADEDGTVLERYGYNAFGLSRVMDADFEPRGSSDYDWETRYGAYRYDSETGFYQIRYRYLHPTLGRWLSRDPVGYRGGWNLLSYVFNRVTAQIDAYGLIASIIEVKFNVLPTNITPGAAAQTAFVVEDKYGKKINFGEWLQCIDPKGRQGVMLTTYIFSHVVISFKVGTDPEFVYKNQSGRTIADHESQHAQIYTDALQNYSDLADHYTGKCICNQKCVDAVTALLKKQLEFGDADRDLKHARLDCEDNDPVNPRTIASCESAKRGSLLDEKVNRLAMELPMAADVARDACDGCGV